MKKDVQFITPHPCKCWLKIFQIMKLSAFFILITTLQVSAKSYSQERVSVNFENARLTKALKEVEKKSSFHFVYSNLILTDRSKVTLQAKDIEVEALVKKLLENTGLTFSLMGNDLIVIKQSISLSDIIVKGKVTDSLGNPIEGATVKVAGKNIGTATNAKGEFSLTVSDNGKLEISYVGFETQTISVDGRKEINVVMMGSVNKLNDVVVVAYGQTTKRDVNSSISTLQMTDVAPIPVQSINDAVGGRIPGVIVTANNGAPGVKSQISIRGGGTPLFVIDDIIRSQNDFENLDPNDIASYSVLKDAAATSLYGARGGNGVVLVTTKKGKVGQININYSFNQIYAQPTIRPKKMSSYDHFAALNAVYIAEGKTPPTADSTLQFYKDQTKPYEYPNTDWQKISLHNFALEQRHDLSLSMGTKELTFYGSLSNYHQGSDLRTDHNFNNRTTYRLNTVSNFEKIHLKVTTGLDGFVEENDVPNTQLDGGTGYNGIYTLIQNQSPQALAYNQSGLPYAGTKGNPVLVLSNLSGYNEGQSRVFNSILGFDWEAPFLKGLHLKANGSYNMWNSMNKSWNETAPSYDLNSLTPIPGPPPSLTGTRGDGSTRTIQGFVTYTHSFGDHNIDFTGVYEQAQDKSESLSATRQQYQILFDQFIAGPTVNQLADGSESEDARASYLGRLSYNFRSKYFIDATIRYDGLDLFPPGKRWGAFYAFSGGWIVSSENFFKALKVNDILNYLKIRGSAGLTGTVDGISPFQYVSGYNINANAWVVNGQEQQGTSEPGTLPSTNFSWFSIRSWDIGSDFALLGNKLTGSIDYFYKRTTGYVASDTRYSATLGIALPPVNDRNAALRRAGTDFDLRWNDKLGPFTYQIGFNFTYFDQLWERTFSEDEADLKDPYTRISGTSDANLQTGYTSAGLYQQNSDLLEGPRRISSTNVVAGDLKYEDVNGDGKLDANDFRRIGSNTFPRINYGVTLDLGYKGIYFDAVLMGTGNRDRYLGDVVQGGSIQANLVYPFQKDYWRPDNEGALFPRAVSYPGVNGNNNFVTSNYWLLRSKYIRLKYLQLGYDLKRSIFKHSPFSDLKIFVSGTNLLTKSKSFKYFIDPESDPNNYAYPIQRTISIGANVGF